MTMTFMVLGVGNDIQEITRGPRTPVFDDSHKKRKVFPFLMFMI